MARGFERAEVQEMRVGAEGRGLVVAEVDVGSPGVEEHAAEPAGVEILRHSLEARLEVRPPQISGPVQHGRRE